jgi:hypothetical protein
MKNYVKSWPNTIFMNLICKFPLFCFILDLEIALFKARERIIEISIEKDVLFDSVSDLEKSLYLSRKKFRTLQKQFSRYKKMHKNCNCHRIILYR